MNAPDIPLPSRRNFLRGSLSTATLLGANALEAAEDERVIRIGFVGCGNRGSFVADIVKENPGFKITAAADYFHDRVNTFGETFGVPAERRFTGLEGFHKMIAAGGIDAVAVHSPPYFHVEHAEAAVWAGKHVLVAKPVAIDLPGCDRIVKLAQDGAAAGIVVLADVQCRGDQFFKEALKRVRDGAIGDLCFGECNYEADTIPLQSTEKTSEGRLRNWVRYRELGGDIITEQNIHALDIVSWAYGTPLSATGISGRSARGDKIGDTADHYAVQFRFRTGAVNFASRQFNGWGLPFRCENRFIGTKGALLAAFGGLVMIRGGKENYWAGGTTKDLYRTGTVANLETFRRAIITGKPEGNKNIESAAQTTLLTLIGQMAADQKRTVSFDEFINTAGEVKADLSGLKA